MTINTTGSIAINGQTGSLGQVLISQGSSTPPSWGNAGGNLVVTDFTATSGQTTFSVTYVVGTVSVYRNGIKLGLADFTATNGTSVVLATGAITGDLIEIQSFSTLTLYSSITSQNFSGNGSTTAFTMNVNPANSASVLVAINGVTQDPSNYTVAGTTLTFSTAPATGTNNISVRYLGVPSTTSVSSFSAGTTGFSPTSAASGAVTLSGTLVVANGGTGLTTLTSGYIPYGAGTAALNSSSTFTFDGTTLFSPSASHSGNLTFTGTGARVLGDFTNATVTNRLSFQTSTTNGTTGIYALPNGSSTAASWQATNAASPTNASKILIATNGSTDVQLVSGVNGSGTYLPLSIWNGGAGRFVIGTSGEFGIGPTASVNYGTAGQVLTSGGSGAPPTWSSAPYTVETLVVGGGGGNYGESGGGGGGGGVVNILFTATSGTAYTMTVGAGGGSGSQGSTSSIAGSGLTTISAIGGGVGAGSSAVAGDGGSGGGGGWTNAVANTYLPGVASKTNNINMGSTGGNNYLNAGRHGAGGGGAGKPGFNTTGTNDKFNGAGGDGLPFSVWCTATSTGSDGYLGGGGGGGGEYYSGGSGKTVSSIGGAGGGGQGCYGGTANTGGTNGAANTGGGGGGHCGNTLVGLSGGSGVVIIRYLGAQRGTGGTITTVNGYTYHKFASTGTFTA